MESTVARLGGLTLQLTNVVRSAVVPSDKMPVAVSRRMVPLASEGSGGVIWIAVKTAAVTVAVVEPLMPSSVALIFAFPTMMPVASPWLPALW